MAAGIEPCTTGLRVNHANLCAVARKQQQIEIFANSTFRIKNKKGETNFLFADNKKCFFVCRRIRDFAAGQNVRSVKKIQFSNFRELGFFNEANLDQTFGAKNKDNNYQLILDFSNDRYRIF